MITFKPIVIPGNRRKDGTYVVNIRITYKGVSRRMATTLICRQADLTRSLKIKSSDILNKSEGLIARMRDAVKDISPFDLEEHDVDWVVGRIKDSMSKEEFHLDFFDWCDRFMATKKPATRRAYVTALNALERFLGKRSIDINDISRGMLLDLKDMIEAEPWMHYDMDTGKIVQSSAPKRTPEGASTRQLSKLEKMFNAAKEKYNDEDEDRILIPRSPFSKIPKVYPMSNGQKNQGVEVMQKIISSETDNPVMRTTLDLVIVSFGLMGVNMADLYAARPFQGNVWIYNRQKTMEKREDRALMKVEIPEQIRPHLARLQGKGEWWLNRLHEFAPTKDLASARVNKYLRRWCEENGIERFTFNAVRHTWGSICRIDCKVDKSTVSDCMCHIGDHKITDIYAEKAWNVMADANRKVMELFTW